MTDFDWLHMDKNSCSSDKTFCNQRIANMSLTIKLERLGPRFFEKDVTVSTEVNKSENLICSVDINGTSVELYPAELDQLIDALTMVKNYSSQDN